MKKILFFFSILLVVISFSAVCLTKEVNAQVSFPESPKYLVKAYVLVPTDWDIDQKFGIVPEEQWKQDILNGLIDVQDFYRDRLNGKTFQIDGDVPIIYSDKAAVGDSQRSIWPADVFKKIDGDRLIFPEERTIQIVFVLGFKTFVPAAQASPERGLIWVNYQDLLTLSNSNDESESLYSRNSTLSTLAHELGHSFGLSEPLGWAKSHPCTVISPQECLDGAPYPRPHEDEYLRDVMGYNSNYPNVTFHNSTFNPLIWKLYQSPFINPEGDPAPEPTDPKPVTVFVDDLYFADLDENQRIITVYGRGFGDNQGKIGLESPGGSSTGATRIISWSDNEIRFLVNDSDYHEDQYHVVVYVDEGRAKSEQVIGFSGRVKFRETIYLTFFNTTTCNNNIPAGNVHIQISDSSNPGVPAIEGFTDENGELSLTLTNIDPKENKTYSVSLIENSNITQTQTFEYSYDGRVYDHLYKPLFYLNCGQENYKIAAPELTEIFISNYPDFRFDGDPLEQGTPTTRINPSDSQDIEFYLSTTNDDQIVYIKEIYSDGNVKDYQNYVDQDGILELPGAKVTIRIPNSSIDDIPLKINLSEIQCSEQSWSDKDTSGEFTCRGNEACYKAWRSNSDTSC